MPSSPQDQVGAIFSHRQIKFYLSKASIFDEEVKDNKN
jgi:hypothetical protein